jgi:hypothetical protein
MHVGRTLQEQITGEENKRGAWEDWKKEADAS